MDLYITAAVVAVLLAALVLCWMQPRRKAGKASPDNTISLAVTLDGADAVGAQLDALTAKGAHLADMLARAKRDAGLIALPVRTGQEPPTTQERNQARHPQGGAQGAVRLPPCIAREPLWQQTSNYQAGELTSGQQQSAGMAQGGSASA